MARSFAAFRAVLCLSTAGMMAISWPLWVTGGEFPRVPWLGWVRLLPAWASWVRFVATLIAMIAAAVPWRWEAVGRRELVIALALSAWMVLEDQFRLQPWMYQFLLMGTALVACREPRAADLCRWLAIAIYFHSGLSKLDPGFLGYTGRSFLHHLTRQFGIDSWSWPVPTRNAAALVFPCWEIGVASALAFGLRRVGLAGAILQHAGLLFILGPWGLDHSTNVLIWNVAMAAEVACLFYDPRALREARTPAGRWSRRREGFAMALVAAACLLPFGERLGYWDTWPSFGLYSAPRRTVLIDVSGDWHPRDSSVVAEPTDRGYWVDASKWSLRERRVPLYPSDRALNGLGEALARRYGDDASVTVTVWDAIRDKRLGHYIGARAIRAYGDTFWLNAHPAR